MTTKLTIHRGTNEIGGTCVEIETEGTRILLDFGMPLVNKQGGSFNFKQYKDLSTSELISKGVLPNIQGAYFESPSIDGVIISHPHTDHFGLMQYLNKDIPVYLGRATHEILKLNNIFINQNNSVNKPHYFEKEISFQIGDIRIVPYWNDHSAFDTYSFHIEAKGKSIFYSGDFRGHGRKEKAYKWFLENAPKGIDSLLIEGTTIGRKTVRFKTEYEIETELVKIFEESNFINYVYTSSQNIDRIVTLYRACLRSGRTLVVDVYTANVLDRLSEFAKLPSPLKGYNNLKVLFTSRLTKKLFHQGYGDLANKFAKCKISKEQISAKPMDHVVIVRPSMKVDLERISTTKGTLIYSMWEGYKKQPTTKDFLNWLVSKNFTIKDIHTSGHADISTLKEYADSINPRNIIPIHTFNKKDYSTIFNQPVIELNDKEMYKI